MNNISKILLNIIFRKYVSVSHGLYIKIFLTFGGTDVLFESKHK